MALEQEKARLKQLIIENALVVSREPLRLSSQKGSNYYFNLKMVLGDPEGLKLISILMLEEINKFGDVKSIGGLETGAIPISIAISRESLNVENLKSFFVRKEPKKHGLELLIEGFPEGPVAVVDDVITSGRSVEKAIDALRMKGIPMRGVVSIIDRGGGKAYLQDVKKLRHVSLFVEEDFREAINQKLEKLNA